MTQNHCRICYTQRTLIFKGSNRFFTGLALRPFHSETLKNSYWEHLWHTIRPILAQATKTNRY